MPDDAIERARATLAETPHSDGCNFLSRALADCDCDRPVRAMIAFASQQAPPEGWRLVPVEPSRAMLEAACEVPYDDEVTGAVIYTTTLEAKAVWSAMLDAAPSVTLGEVG